MDESTQVVSEFRGTLRDRPQPVSWLDHPTMRKFLHRRISGDPDISTVEWFKHKFFPRPVDLALSLGCGFGNFERAALQLQLADRFHANDVSAGAIEGASAAAAAAGLSERVDYSVADLNEIKLGEQQYDAVFAISSFHHVFQLERLCKECRAALKPGGLFLLDECIGPSRFQSSQFVVETINRILFNLPERYRYNLFAKDGSAIGRYTPSPVEHFEKFDPSEAIRSGEIMSVLRMYFDVIEFRPYGGALLHMLLSGIVGNFEPGDERDDCVLNLLATFEEMLEQQGVIESHFAVIVCRPK